MQSYSLSQVTETFVHCFKQATQFQHWFQCSLWCLVQLHRFEDSFLTSCVHNERHCVDIRVLFQDGNTAVKLTNLARSVRSFGKKILYSQFCHCELSQSLSQMSTFCLAPTSILLCEASQPYTIYTARAQKHKENRRSAYQGLEIYVLPLPVFGQIKWPHYVHLYTKSVPPDVFVIYQLTYIWVCFTPAVCCRMR